MIHIVLYEPEIPFNTGNIGRLALANNCKLHLIEPLGFSIDNSKVKRSGLDYWKNVDLQVYQSWEIFIENMQIQYKIIPSQYYYFTTKSSKAYWDIDYHVHHSLLPIIMVFGAETRGLPAEILDIHAAHNLTIPMYNHPQVRSLNLSSSVAIVLYEILRQLYNR